MTSSLSDSLMMANSNGWFSSTSDVNLTKTLTTSSGSFPTKPSSSPLHRFASETLTAPAMRPLDEKETTLVFEKLFKFVGPNLKHIIERPAVEGPDPSGYCFRLHRNRVYYASESLVRRATSISRPKLVSLGLPIGKITKSGQFRLTIHSLDLLTAHARNKIWLKPAAEMTFLYGNSVTKSMLARITENTKAGDGVVVLSMSDLPLGFGVAARSTQDCRKADTNSVVVHHQADNGEYLRNEEDL